MTSRPAYLVEPQRSDGSCCEPHQATSFAVIEVKKWTKKLSGRTRHFTSQRVITRKPTHNSAQLEAEAMTRRAQLLDLYKLGKRIIKPGT